MCHRAGHHDPPAAGRENHSAQPGELAREPQLELAEVGFPTLGEDPGDGSALAPFDLRIQVEERTSEPPGHAPSDGGLPAAG
jgi:hypothetical protein